MDDFVRDKDEQNRRKRKTTNESSKDTDGEYEQTSKRGKKIIGKRGRPKEDDLNKINNTSAKNRKTRKRNKTNNYSRNEGLSSNDDEESSSNGAEESSSDEDENSSIHEDEEFSSEDVDTDSDIYEDLDRGNHSDGDLNSESKSSEGKEHRRQVKRRSARQLQLSSELAAIVGAEKMAPFEIVMKIQHIINERNLYDPINKMFAICDEELLKIFKVRRFRRFGIIAYLKDHFISKRKNVS